MQDLAQDLPQDAVALELVLDRVRDHDATVSDEQARSVLVSKDSLDSTCVHSTVVLELRVFCWHIVISNRYYCSSDGYITNFVQGRRGFESCRRQQISFLFRSRRRKQRDCMCVCGHPVLYLS